MAYFYGKSSAALYSKIGPKCYTSQQVLTAKGQVKEEKDGVVSVYIPNNVGKLVPVHLTSQCCKVLGSKYTFDIDSQLCRWAPASEDICGLKDPFKLVLNPKGNDGSIFYVESDETCELSIDFKYLFKVKCENLADILNPVVIQSPVNEEIIFEIRNLQNQIDEMTKKCQSLTWEISSLQTDIANTPYSVQCDFTEPFSPVGQKWTKNLGGFANTGFGRLTNQSPISPFSFDLEDYAAVTYCLTEPSGLSAWRTILGADRYQLFLNGDSTSYTCADVRALATQNTNNSLLDVPGPVLINNCTVPFGTKTQLIKQLNELLASQRNCNATITTLQNELAALQQTTTAPNSACKTPIEFFETFNVTATLEVVSGGTNQTVASFPLFNTIGVGQLYNYLVAHPQNSAFYVCGDSSGSCTPMTFDLNNDTNTGTCDGVMNNLLDALYAESGLSGTSNGHDTFTNNLPVESLASKWVSFSTLVTDPEILKVIANQKIKISFEINHACGDFCVLVDEIVLDKKCTRTLHNNIFLTQSPGFELDRIRDNKKSWIANTTPENRPFSISNNLGGNTIRQTNYDVNDERLIINSKEIDLDIDIASAVEYDVWCYVTDNPTILDCLSGCTSDECVGCNVGEVVPYAVNNNIDFDAILMSNLPSKFQSLTAYTLTTYWSISVTNCCDTLYQDDSFFVGTGSTGTTLAPNTAEYKAELDKIAAHLGFTIVHSGDTSTFYEINDCIEPMLDDCFKINLNLSVYACYVETPSDCGPLSGFCDTRTYQVDYVLPSWDMLDDIRYYPTCEQLESYTCPPQGELDEIWVTGRNEYLKAINEVALAVYTGYYPAENPYYSASTDYSWNITGQTTFNNGPFKHVNMKWFRAVDEYAEWTDIIPCTGTSLSAIFTGVTGFTYLHPVDDISMAPTGCK